MSSCSASTAAVPAAAGWCSIGCSTSPWPTPRCATRTSSPARALEPCRPRAAARPRAPAEPGAPSSEPPMENSGSGLLRLNGYPHRMECQPPDYADRSDLRALGRGPRGCPRRHNPACLRVATHVATAVRVCPSLREKKITVRVLRHTSAMRLLHAGVDTSVIALWLGHEHVETTQIYLHADLALKERALARTTPVQTSPGRYQPPDTLLAFLEAL